MQLCNSLNILWHYPSLGLKWKLTFSSPEATAEFSRFAGILSAALSHHHLSGFEIAGIPSLPLALFLVLPPKAHLTSHSSMSCFRWWSHHQGYLGHEHLFCIVLLCILTTSSWYLLLLLGPYYLCPYWAHLWMKCSLCISNFLEEITNVFHSFVFLYFFALVTEEAFLISPYYSLELYIQMGISFLFSFAFHFTFFHSYL